MKKVGVLVREDMTDHIKGSVEKYNNTFLMSYAKVSSGQMSDFRKNLKKIGAELYISKNRMAQRALKDLKFEDLASQIEGQTAFVWSDADSVEVSKVLVNFTKNKEGVLVKGALSDGKILKREDVKRLSDLPSKEVLLSMLFSTMQSPLTRLTSALNGKTRELIYLLKQLSEQKGGK